MLNTKTDIRDWYDATFGPGWKVAFAMSTGVTRQSVANAAPGTPTYTMLETSAEFMRITKPRRWPARWSLLKKLKEKQSCSCPQENSSSTVQSGNSSPTRGSFG